MADNTDLTVRFGAQTSELEQASQKASASVKAATDGMRVSAEQARQAFAQFGTDLSKIKPDQMSGLAAATKQVAAAQAEASAAMSSISASAHGAGAGIGFYARELHAMVDEGLSGRFRQLQGTATNVLFTLAQANPVAAGAAVGIAALAGAIGYLVYEGYEAEKAGAAIRLGLNMGGVVDATTAQINSLRDAIAQLPGASSTLAGQVVASFTQMSNISMPLMQGLVNVIGDFAAATNTTVEEAGKTLKKMFEDPLSAGTELRRVFPALTSDQIALYTAAQVSGNVFRAQAAILAIVSQQSEHNRQVLAQHAQTVSNLSTEMALAAQSDGQFAVALQQDTTAIDNATAAAEKRLQVVRDTTSALQSMPSTQEHTIKTGMEAGDKEGSPEESYGKAKTAIQQMSAALDELRAKAGTNPTQEQEAAIARLAFQYENAKNKAEALKNATQGGSDLAISQAAGKVASNLGAMSKSDDTQVQIQGLRDTLATAQLTAEARTQLEVQLSEKIKQLRDVDAADAAAHEELKAALAKKGSAEQYDAQAGAIRARMAAQHEGDADYTNSQTALTNLARQHTDEQLAEARSVEEGKYAIQLKGIESSMANVKEEAKAKEISNQQELSQLLALQAQKEDIERSHLTFVASTYQDDAKAYAAAQMRLNELTATNAQERAAITRDADKELQAEYTKTFEQIGSTISSSLMSIIEGTGSWYKLMQNISRQLVSDFLSANIKIVADFAATQARQLVAGLATQTGLTSATAAGVAARSSATAAGAVSDAAANVAAVGRSIMASAGEAFAGVAGFLAPIMGPAALGPAASTEGAVLAAAGAIGGSYAVGSWKLPSDQIAQVHQGEMIVPAAATPWAQSLMSNAAGGGQGGGDTHYHNWNNTVNGARDPGAVVSEIKNNIKSIGQVFAKASRQGHFNGAR